MFCFVFKKKISLNNFLLLSYYNCNNNFYFFIERLLHDSLDPKLVSKEHFPWVSYYISENDNSISWNFYKDNYLLLNKTFGIDKVNLIGNDICRTFFDEKDKQKVIKVLIIKNSTNFYQFFRLMICLLYTKWMK